MAKPEGLYTRQVDVEREARRVWPTECHACQDKMCPTADDCDRCKMPEKPARTKGVR